MGASDSKTQGATPPVVIEKDSPAAMQLRQATMRMIFDFYKNADGLWGFDEVRRYYEDVEGREIDRHAWADTRMHVVYRKEPPFSSMEFGMMDAWLKEAQLEPHRFLSMVHLPARLNDMREAAQAESKKREEAEKVARRLKARNDALKDRCAGMNKRLKEIKTHFGASSEMSSMCSYEDAASSSLADAEFLADQTPTRMGRSSMDTADEFVTVAARNM